MEMTFSRSAAIATTGLFIGSALVPSGSAFAAATCPTGSTLVDTNICEVTFTADGTWTPPAGVTKVQALLVGAGGASDVADGDGYSGGAGEVRLVNLATTGAVTVTVGLGGGISGGDGGDTRVVQGSTDEVANGGQTGAPGGAIIGGASGSGYEGDLYNYGGGGAGGAADGNNGGIGLVVNEIDPTTFTLFANDGECYGGGGAGTYSWLWNSDPTGAMNYYGPGCWGGYAAIPNGATVVSFPTWTWSGTPDDVELQAPTANRGGGAGALDLGSTIVTDDGADGVVVIRFAVSELAATGFDATAPALAGVALVTAGVVAVARRRKATR